MISWAEELQAYKKSLMEWDYLDLVDEINSHLMFTRQTFIAQREGQLDYLQVENILHEAADKIDKACIIVDQLNDRIKKFTRENLKSV